MKSVFLMSLCVFVGPERERKVPRSGFRKLGTQHVTTDVFSLAVGHPVFHQLSGGWVHCRLCHVDIEINLRGQSAWKEHWRSPDHYAREFQYRIDNHLPLYAANYQLTNPGRGKKLDLVDPASIPGDELRRASSGVYLEPIDRLSIAERQARDSTKSPISFETFIQAMWVSTLIDGLVRGRNFLSVCASLEMAAITASHLGEASFLPYTVDVVKVSSNFVFCLSPNSSRVML